MIKINWKPDKSSGTSLYKQIVSYMKEKISNGEWTLGSRLPTQRELSERFEVNRSTVIEALSELKAEGLIEGNSRGGTKIVNNAWSVLMSTSPTNWQNYITSGLHKPNLQTIQLINELEFEEGMIRLGTGELSPDLYPKEMMKTVLTNVSDKINSLGYEEPKGLLYLRQVLSQYVKKYGINVSPDSILIVSGSLQAFQLISMGILSPGSTVLTERPSYIKSLSVFESSGMRLNGIDMDAYGAKPKDILKSINSKDTSLLYTIPTFHNPTGIIMPKSRRDEILELCSNERLPIIEDDVYRELWLDEEPPKPLKAEDKNDNILYLGSISKTLAAGLRIGWLIGPEVVVERLGDIKMQTDYGSSSLSQWALAEWIESGLYNKHILEVRKNLKLRRQIVLRCLDEYFSDIATWNKPKGGFYIWLNLNKQISMNKLFKDAYKNGLLINIGNIYDFSNNSNIRISYSYASLIDLEEGLKKLSKLIRECD
ncbi:PLP-dependent aminotransferase family protein [Clostridium sp. YIM B02506]|uniref:aminotransferase-like domain-containing protein n=1 Tax=Clostridium sp. YIM B02506 TaxID=2910680 RepID=UPI001EEEF09B|nr:PLP-dependent aminotransferase family protein [Clostridium sp. YIM B02506]